MNATWWVYLLRCADNSLYCGITTDLSRRLNEHNGSGQKGAKYTKARRPVRLAYAEIATDRAQASQREYQLRRQSKTAKESLVASYQDSTTNKAR
jgi:putative endonuclease